MKVRVYYNLHRHLWSVQGYVKGRGWRIIGHASELLLDNVVFKVSEKGRQRVIREKRKNVHAYAIGDLVYTLSAMYPDGRSWDEYAGSNPFPNEHFKIKGKPAWLPLVYNPYKGPDFTMDGQPVDSVPKALFMGTRKLFGLTSVGTEVY